jgi:hypothetical protein
VYGARGGYLMAKTKTKTTQKILPHGDIESPISGVWMVTGICPFPLRRRMTAWKLPDGSLLAHSVIAMDEAGMAQLDALGKVSIIVVPHAGHRLDAGFYKQRYPQARVIAPAAARAKVQEVIPVDATAEDELPRHGIKIHAVPGWKHGELGYQLPLPGGGQALVLADVLGNSDPPPGLGGWLVAKTTTGIKGPLGVARIMKLVMLIDRGAARAGLQRLADIPDLRFVSVAHGRPVLTDCAAVIRQAAATL